MTGRPARAALVLLASCASLAAASCAGGGRRARPHDRRPGPGPDGAMVLPSGWQLTPAGPQLEVGDFPISVDVDLEERYAAIVLSGASEQGVAIVDLESRRVVSRERVKRAWLGGAFWDRGRKYVLSGAHDDVLHVWDFDRERGELTKTREIAVRPAGVARAFAAGLDVHQDSATAYVVLQVASRLAEVDLANGKLLRSIELPDVPYTCLVSRDGSRVYVSIWGNRRLLVLDRARLEPIQTIEVGPHPNAMAESEDGRLFVACANDDSVAVVDARALRVVERLRTSVVPHSPPGSTPNALALLPGEIPTLAVANADNNAIAWFELGAREGDGDEEEEEEEGAGGSRALGFIPTGWYPTALRFLRRRGELFVVSGKGVQSLANPDGPLSPLRPKGAPGKYHWTGALMTGTVGAIPIPNDRELAAWTRRVLDNTPLADDWESAGSRDPNNPIPRRAGEPSPIRYVLYVIKENRTYDQIFGAEARGNGDPRLVLFGEDVTPNHHALSRRFVLLDNTFADAEVSADGHQWSMGAYATDYTEKLWPTEYGPGGGFGYVFEGEGMAKLVRPQGGYLWDAAARAGVSYRSYGEFVVNPKDRAGECTTTIPALQGRIAPKYWGWDLAYRDVDRVEAYLAELRGFEAAGDMPRLQILRLPNDHTAGTSRNHPTPRAMVADNDLALGRLVEGISRSRFWPQTAIFVLEDDAQNGPDHVDAHRMVSLVISPWARRGAVDSTLYSTTSILRTMELILGLQPMSQFDAVSTPMWRSFASTPDAEPYTALVPSQRLDQMNAYGAPGQARSESWDFTREDAAPDIELNEVVWQSVRGAASPMPPPVRAPWAAWAQYLGAQYLGAQRLGTGPRSRP